MELRPRQGEGRVGEGERGSASFTVIGDVTIGRSLSSFGLVVESPWLIQTRECRRLCMLDGHGALGATGLPVFFLPVLAG